MVLVLLELDFGFLFDCWENKGKGKRISIFYLFKIQKWLKITELLKHCKIRTLNRSDECFSSEKDMSLFVLLHLCLIYFLCGAGSNGRTSQSQYQVRHSREAINFFFQINFWLIRREEVVLFSYVTKQILA